VLLLAGANVANLQLVRETNRTKTLAIEAALGASRFRLARSLCAETLLLALAGGAAGLAAAVWMNDLYVGAIPADVYRMVPGLRQVRVDSAVVFFTVVLSLITGILCSLPAIAHLLGPRSSLMLGEALSQGDRKVAGDMRSRMRNILVIGEIAVALLLLVGAGVMVSTFQHMLALNLGFNTSNVLTAEIALPKQQYAENTQVSRFFDRLLPELSTIPSVRNVSVEAGAGPAVGFSIEGRQKPGEGEPKPNIRIVDAQYFQTMQLPLLRGRGILEQDQASSMPVIVISESVARHYWPGSDPIGRRIGFNFGPPLSFTIVGVAGDTVDWFFNQPEPAVYVSYRQTPGLSLVSRTMRILLRTSGDPSLAAKGLISSVRAADPGEPLYQIKSMEQIFSDQRSGVQASARMMSGNALIALFLAVTGIYGVISYFVIHRTKEIGVRIALGASAPDILKMTLGQACRLAGAGLLIGVPASYVLMRLLSNALYNVVVVKWTTFSSAAALLPFAALLAAYLPARRAATVDPVVALRAE
jgi:putative ABC transport system permease protein